LLAAERRTKSDRDRRLTFVHCVKDDLVVGLEFCSKPLPPIFETFGIGDNLIPETTVIVRDNHCVRPFAGDVVHRLAGSLVNL